MHDLKEINCREVKSESESLFGCGVMAHQIHQPSVKARGPGLGILS